MERDRASSTSSLCGSESRASRRPQAFLEGHQLLRERLSTRSSLSSCTQPKRAGGSTPSTPPSHPFKSPSHHLFRLRDAPFPPPPLSPAFLSPPPPFKSPPDALSHPESHPSLSLPTSTRADDHPSSTALLQALEATSTRKRLLRVHRARERSWRLPLRNRQSRRGFRRSDRRVQLRQGSRVRLRRACLRSSQSGRSRR